MSLKVIGAGLGRTGTLSLKLALEHIGFHRCYHAMEIGASLRKSLPLWKNAIEGIPNWKAIFDGYSATVDYPGCCFWKELFEFFPESRIILSVREANDWYESVRETIFSNQQTPSIFGTEGRFLGNFIRRDFADRIDDREFMIDYFNRWNQSVIDAVPSNRLLVFSAADGWESLCNFLGCPTPEVPYPHLHARPTGQFDQPRELPADTVDMEIRLRAYLARIGAERLL